MRNEYLNTPTAIVYFWFEQSKEQVNFLDTKVKQIKPFLADIGLICIFPGLDIKILPFQHVRDGFRCLRWRGSSSAHLSRHGVRHPVN
jgi:hypothetical protein